MRGWRQRKLINSEGNIEKLKIRRLRCPGCKRIHHELPDCIVPYKRHCAKTIEDIINNKTAGAPCENGTIGRVKGWWETMQPYFLNIIISLAEKYQAQFKTPPAFKEIIRAVVNGGAWTFVKTICTRSAFDP